MKFYKLKALSVGANSNRVLRKEDNKTYPENTWPEKTAEELVKLGYLIRVKADSIKAKPDVKSKTEKEKPKDKEPSLLDSMMEARGTETEKTSKDDEKKALYEEASKLAKEKGIKSPHRLMGIEKLKVFINDNKDEKDNLQDLEIQDEDKPEVKEPSLLDSMEEAGDDEKPIKETETPEINENK